MDRKTAAIYRLMYLRLKSIERYAKQSEAIQMRQFKRIMRVLRGSAYEQSLTSEPIRSYSDYQRIVPIVEYEELRPWVERMLQGERNQLIKGSCRWFATSSGTSGGRSKYLPVPGLHLQSCHYQGAKDALWLYLDTRPDSEFFAHKSLVIGGSHKPTAFAAGTHTGALSAILVENMPTLGQMYRVPSKQTLLMSEWTAKMRQIVREVATADVGSLSGVPSWMLETIMAILAYTGRENLSEVWPHLEVFFHGGISFDPYRERYRQIIPSERMQYRETYNASEGFFGVQDDPTSSSMLLMQDYGILYEFIPMSQFDAPDRQAIPLADVQKGVNYALVISTLGGLYRYIIGDTVMFTELHPYKFIITGRTQSFINAFGEELMVHNTTTAVSRISQEMGVTVLDYTVAPRFCLDTANGYHEWIVEFETPPADPEHFIERIDQELRTLNSDYEAKRYANMALLMPRLVVARRGLFNDWLEEQGKLGGQHKIPRLRSNADLNDRLIELNK